MWRHLLRAVTALGLTAAVTIGADGQTTPARPGTVGASVGAGVLFGTTGFVLGGVVGHAVPECPPDAQCRDLGMVLGAAAGGTLGMAVGVHLGNQGRGDFFRSLMAGVAIWAGAVGIAAAAGNGGAALPAALVLLPALELAAMVAIEHSTARSRDAAHETARDGVTLRVVPALTATEVGFRGSVRF